METEREVEVEVEDGEYPFRGLVICVTGISKGRKTSNTFLWEITSAEERKKVKEATESLGGSYSPNLHPNCTHLLVTLSPNRFPGPKLQHALTHPSAFTNHLFVVTLRWFLDCLTTCSRLHESSYSLHSLYSASRRDSCFPVILKLPPEQITRPNSEAYIQDIKQSHQQPHLVYIDSDVSVQLHTKVVDVVVQEGGMLANQWFVGCGADYVVCEGSSIQKYLGHCDNIVSPIWFLKPSKERSMQRFVGMSADLAREAGLMLEKFQHVTAEQETEEENYCKNIFTCDQSRVSQAEKLKIVKLAKCGIRNRRARRLQSCEVRLRPINSGSLLESICWSISEPTSTVTVYEETISSQNTCDIQKNTVIDGHERVESDLSFSNLLRPLTESERSELVFRNQFLTILFPVDRFAEMGPSSRTYFSDSGFTCLQLLDFIYDFYQESMSEHEIQAAIHTDSRHAELLRSRYCSDREQTGDMVYKRILFMGSRKSFEKLKRVNGDNNSNVYELLIRE